MCSSIFGLMTIKMSLVIFRWIKTIFFGYKKSFRNFCWKCAVMIFFLKTCSGGLGAGLGRELDMRAEKGEESGGKVRL